MLDKNEVIELLLTIQTALPTMTKEHHVMCPDCHRVFDTRERPAICYCTAHD